MEGRFTHHGETHTLTSASHPPTDASLQWLKWFHSLNWLGDLKALSGTKKSGEAAYFAREWVSAWVSANSKWSHPAWNVLVTADRVVNWIWAWDFLISGESAGAFERILRQTAARDARHLYKSTPPHNVGFARLHVIHAQLFTAFALLGSERCQNTILARLETEINVQILPDGGHIERNPELLSHVLHDLLQLRQLCCVAMGQVPEFIQNAIDRTAPMLRTLRHLDGKLALFNGGSEGNAAYLDRLLGLTDPSTTSPVSAPYAGFQKLSADSTTILMDCGKPGGPGNGHHAGTLSFEMCIGKNRLIVNCGARSGEADPWRTALAATAAHATLTVNDTSSAAFAIDGTLRRGPEVVTCERKDSEHGTLIEASHDGYVNTFGLVHHRSLYLSPMGDDVRGEDRLVGTGGEYATIRFHLHPDVHVSVLGGGNGALLRLDTKNKDTWRLRTSMGEVKLEDSIYLGRYGEHRRSEQIVISTPLTGNGALIKWSLSREGKSS
ncbi:MAG: heparinase II/III family protein [Magnetovibrio sp.]|nr:heparinase II/III family protein [Magnetovibrio sp.]